MAPASNGGGGWRWREAAAIRSPHYGAETRIHSISIRVPLCTYLQTVFHPSAMNFSRSNLTLSYDITSLSLLCVYLSPS